MGKRLYSDARETVRSLLRNAREKAEITQTDLAEKLGRPQSYVSDYERGHRRLDWVAVHEVLTACDADLVAFAREYLSEVSKAR